MSVAKEERNVGRVLDDENLKKLMETMKETKIELFRDEDIAKTIEEQKEKEE